MNSCGVIVKNTAVISAVAVLLSGCASIVSKSQYPVTIQSNPSGATVFVRDKNGTIVHRAVTPATLSLKAGSGYFSSARYTFEFKKDGYHNGSTSLSAGMDPWFAGNIIFGGLIGILIVDPITGAMWKLDDTIYGNLSENKQAQTAASASMASVNIADKLKELKVLKDSGMLTEDEYETKRKALVQSL